MNGFALPLNSIVEPTGTRKDRCGMITILRVVALVSTGLMAGIFLGHRIGLHYALPALSPSTFVQLGQTIAVRGMKIMPPLVFTALFSNLLWLAMLRREWRTAEFWLVAVSACAMLVSIAVTMAVNVPLNKQLMTWSIASPPTNLQEIWAPWERVNTLRSVLATGALALEALAVSLGANAR
jgi:uncharacterized membrane protein